MTRFTDPAAAIAEAEFLATQTDQPQAIVRDGDGMQVMGYNDAWLQRLDVIETVTPTWEDIE